MASLSATLIDVGWGDSILIESVDNQENESYALIDSNDTTYLQSSYIFLKKYFERKGIDIDASKPIFDFVLLSHAHTDHGQGLKSIMRAFGSRSFYYPKSINWSSLAYLIQYANRSSNITHHQSLDDTKILPKLGNVKMNVMWPEYANINNQNENNNSIVLLLTLKNVSYVLTGDSEIDVWTKISNQIPNNSKFFKIPHHGSENGTFDNADNVLWLNNLPDDAKFGISSHVRPFNHPSLKVINYFKNKPLFRTDLHYHVTFTTDGDDIEVKYSHV